MTEKEEMFYAWEKSSRDTIDVKRCYVDLTGDLVAGVVLSQIVFWFLPDKQGQRKATIERDGRRWLAKPREAWWEECRVTPKQFDRAVTLLESLGIVHTALWKFNGVPVKHLSLNVEVLIDRLGKSILTKGENGFSPKTVEGENGFSPKVKMDFDLLGKSYKEDIIKESLKEETTTEIKSSDFTLGRVKSSNFTLPDWIPRKAWDDFEAMRKKNRKPMTDRARELAVSQLEKLRREGNPPGEVLNQSVLCGYQGLFAVKANGNGSRRDAADRERPRSIEENTV
jgi:hypothetical protein